MAGQPQARRTKMIRKSMFAIAASVMTLTAFSGTLGLLQVDNGPTVQAIA